MGILKDKFFLVGVILVVSLLLSLPVSGAGAALSIIGDDIPKVINGKATVHFKVSGDLEGVANPKVKIVWYNRKGNQISAPTFGGKLSVADSTIKITIIVNMAFAGVNADNSRRGLAYLEYTRNGVIEKSIEPYVIGWVEATGSGEKFLK